VRFYPGDAPVPATLVTPEFTLEPLNASHVELDFDALMSSRPRLNLWSGNVWPRDDFTLAENLEDLEGHDAEQRAREAFTYTVLAPDRQQCLGCVYINSMAEFLDSLDVPASARPATLDDDALVTCWARASVVPLGFETHLVAALLDWLAREWAFQRVTFATTERFVEQQRAFEAAGLREVWSYAATPNPLRAFKLYRVREV
jgi:RimJ/RimL family protein N-acetyltransferase